MTSPIGTLRARAAAWAARATTITLMTVPLVAAATDPARDKALGRLLEAVCGPERQAPGAEGRALLQAVLSQPSFEHAEVGPFDVYVYKVGSLAKARAGKKLLSDATDGLGRVAELFGRLPARPDGLVSGRRFPIVLTPDVEAYQQVVALLDRCEDDGLSGWKPANGVWSQANCGAEVTRTWEAQVFNLSHKAIVVQGKAWMEHGLGYYAIAHLTNRLLRQGAWGNVPPWLAQGLIDELDIEAHGEAWVGSSVCTAETSGWSRPGWSAFVPQGCLPPVPVTGPSADLAVVVKRSGDAWENREASARRHWADLVADRKSDAPASFAFMAQHETFFPRDRAYARCLMSIVLEVAPGAGGLLQSLDHEGGTSSSGMPDGDPLPVVFTRSLGVSLPELDKLEALSLQDMLAEIGHEDVVDRIRALGASGMLEVADHRDQAAWLHDHVRFLPDVRGLLFDLILEAEYWQQLREWELIGEHLDAAAAAALRASTRYPKSAAERARVANAFREALRAQ